MDTKVETVRRRITITEILIGGTPMAFFRRTKKAIEDDEAPKLPQTRRAVFFDIVKYHWGKLLWLSLLLLAVALPLLLICVYEDAYLLTVAKDPNTPLETIPALIAPLRIYCALLSIPGLAIFFWGLSGVIRVMRQLAWERNVTAFQDFISGLRQNQKQFLPVSLLFALCYALARIGWHNALATQAESVWGQGIILGLLIFLVAPLVAYSTVAIAVYSNSFWGNLKLSAYLYLRSPLKTIGAMLLAFGPSVVVWLIPHLQLHLIGCLPTMVVFVLGLLGWVLFSYNQLDKHCNAEHYPELVGRGINGQ